METTPPTPATPATPPTPATPATPAAPVASAAPAVPAVIQFDDFAKIQLRVATVLECKVHPNADKLLLVQLDLGNGEKRQVCAGIRAHYQPEQLVGKQVIVVANLAPRQMRGEISQGMILAASDPTTGKVIVVGPSEAMTPGSKVS